MSSPATSYYFERFGFAPYLPPLVTEPPHPHLGMIIVIPCFNEPDLLASLNSLWRCDRPKCAVEIIVVINSSESSPPETLEQNRRTIAEAELWSREDCDRAFRIHFLHTPNLPRKHAGVGLARKIGMDEALHRLDQLNRREAPIICFDADSTCDPNYLTEIESFCSTHPKSPGCSIYFEHPLEHDLIRHGDTENTEKEKKRNPPLRDLCASVVNSLSLTEAITLYELHLRYYVEALRFAGFPHAFHTIGSSMAVRASAYLRQGGMNKRQAGEDFYFLHKIIPLGNFGEINTTRVIPSPRPSDRVPFGTGRAVRDYLVTRKFETYPLQAFHDLKQFFSQIEAFSQVPKPPTHGVPPLGGLLAQLAPPLQQFIATQKITAVLAEIRAHITTPEAFRARFFRWFDGFLAMKYIHHARDTAYGPTEITEAARELIKTKITNARDLLLEYRARQRGGSFPH